MDTIFQVSFAPSVGEQNIHILDYFDKKIRYENRRTSYTAFAS